MNDLDKFLIEKQHNINSLSKDTELKKESIKWIEKTARYSYSYNFSWLGLPIIQYPQDIIAMQEIIWETKPDLIIETGIARGGSIIFYASMLELLGKGEIIGIDINIRTNNREMIENHPMFKRITMLEGSSTDELLVKSVKQIAEGKEKILIVLDSDHTHSHVKSELELYSPLVGKGSYIVVFDTVIEDMSKGYFKNKPWDVGNNPKTAVLEFLNENKRFEIDKSIEEKLLITVAYGGYLKCIKDNEN